MKTLERNCIWLAGTYAAAQSVTLKDATTGAVIYYTTNGATPTTASTKYSATIAVTASETIKAIAVASGYTTSSVTSATYTIEKVVAYATATGYPNESYDNYEYYDIESSSATPKVLKPAALVDKR